MSFAGRDAFRGFVSEFGPGLGWRVLIGAFLGSAVGVTSIPFYTIGVFVAPLQEAFGWGRGQIQASIAFSMLGTILAAAPTGWLTDRIGVRKVALGGLICLALALVAFGMAGPSLPAWYAAWTAMAFFGAGTTAITWTRGIADWFEKGRGLALGLALAGNGFTAVLAPPLVTAIIQAHGWRVAYFTLAASVIVVGLIPTWLWFHARDDRAAVKVQHSGLSLGQALRHYRLWVMTIGFIVISFALAGAIPNLVPLMIDRGYSPLHAAGFASLIGVSIIVGRAGAGYLLDHFWAPGVGAALLVLPSAACLVLATPGAPAPVIGACVFCIGLTAGMEFDLMGYLCARYFGLKSYGKIFAWPWVGFAIGAATGATAFGWVRDRTGSYESVLFLGAGAFVAGAALFLLLGRYPDLDRPEAAA